MAHKVHPKSFRIKEINDWNIRGFYGKNPAKMLEEDFLIKEFLKKRLAEHSVANIELERFADKINIIIHTARPGLIIGRGGEGVEKLKSAIIKEIKKIRKEIPKREIKIEIREVKNPFLSASVVAQQIAQQIEKRVPYRQVLKRTLEKVMSNKKEVKGVRLEVSGRLNGVEIARREWMSQGKLPRQTLRADFDYAEARAHCTYGTIGIKVWIYKGEKFD